MASLASLHILLVDDNEHMRAITSTILRAAGVRHIREVADGSIALEMLRHFPIDIAIVDFDMDVMNGLAFTQAVRKIPRNPLANLPIIMLTGHTEMHRVLQARDVGVTEFVVKPISAKALFERIEALIMRPRLFVTANSYIGPDRRRSKRGPYTGPDRRPGELRS